MRKWVVFILFVSVLACRDTNDDGKVLKPAVWAKEKASVKEKHGANVTLHWAVLKQERTQ